jgi:hypothetical protein
MLLRINRMAPAVASVQSRRSSTSARCLSCPAGAMNVLAPPHRLTRPRYGHSASCQPRTLTPADADVIEQAFGVIYRTAIARPRRVYTLKGLSSAGRTTSAAGRADPHSALLTDTSISACATSSPDDTRCVNGATGKLIYLGSTPAEKQSRGFAIDPAGEKSDTISAYAIDEASGALPAPARSCAVRAASPRFRLATPTSSFA